MLPFLIMVGMRGTFDPLPLTLQRYRAQVSDEAHLNSIQGTTLFFNTVSVERLLHLSNKKIQGCRKEIKIFVIVILMA